MSLIARFQKIKTVGTFFYSWETMSVRSQIFSGMFGRNFCGSKFGMFDEYIWLYIHLSKFLSKGKP